MKVVKKQCVYCSKVIAFFHCSCPHCGEDRFKRPGAPDPSDIREERARRKKEREEDNVWRKD